MGWLYPYSTYTRELLIKHLRRPERFGDRAKLLAATAVGNNHWYLVQNLDSGRVLICLDRMAGGRRNNPGWGFKDLCEYDGPYEYNCPLHYLDKASTPEPGSHAVAWRECVKQYHAQRSARPKPVSGALVEYGVDSYRLEGPAVSARRGWLVSRISDGVRFRMSAKQLANAKFLSVNAA
jgi:hypothetical protein